MENKTLIMAIEKIMKHPENYKNSELMLEHLNYKLLKNS